MQKDLGPMIFYLLYCMNWDSSGITRSLLRIRAHSHRIRIVVKLYDHTLRLRYGCISTIYKNNPQQQIMVLYELLSSRIRQPDTGESAFRSMMKRRYKTLYNHDEESPNPNNRQDCD